VKKLLGFIGMTIGGWAGWALGAPFGMMTAFIVSIIGTGAGAYVAIRVASNYDI
jgi:hypothetical protein